MDAFIVVVEPGQRSVQTAHTVRDLATGLGVKRVFVVANKVREEREAEFIRSSISDMELLGTIAYSPDVIESDLSGVPPYEKSPGTVKEVESLKKSLESRLLEK